MAIITISRGPYSRGKEIANGVAQRLGYRCIAREVVLDASKEFNIPESRLVRAVHDAPSLLDKNSSGKEKYIAYFRAALLKQLQQDNVVYHGLAGHFFLKGVRHALKVRILANMEDRIQVEMEREKVSREQALRNLKADDAARRKWSLDRYGIDPSDPSLYDLVISTRKTSTDEIADMICKVVGLDRFRTTEESQKTIVDMALAAKVRACLMNIAPEVDVRAEDGFVKVSIGGSLEEEAQRAMEIQRAAEAVPGVKGVEILEARIVKGVPYFS